MPATFEELEHFLGLDLFFFGARGRKNPQIENLDSQNTGQAPIQETRSRTGREDELRGP